MAAETNISWADHTWNPWIGCTRLGPACDGCYAAALMGTEGRHKRAVWGGPGVGAGTRVRTKTWGDPLRWNRAAEAAGTRPFVFCASLADIFDNKVDPAWRAEAFDVMRRTPHLVYLLLTKRPGLIERLAREAGGLPANAAIGCTVVTQEEAERDVPNLLLAKRATSPLFAFLSMEPLLGAVDLAKLWTMRFRGAEVLNALTGELTGIFGDPCGTSLPSVDWVIAGGETDQGRHRARPTNPQWFRDLRNQCAAAGVPFHHKQNGEWVSVSEVEGPGEIFTFPDLRSVRRTGKARAGRTIDGAVYDARPQVAA